jgi:glucose/arabinose dehydrogenase/cytochrome c2
MCERRLGNEGKLMYRNSAHRRLASLLAVATSFICISAHGAPEGASVAAGRTVFRQQCSVCHTAEPDDNGGAQGPSLVGVYGRHAASAASFGYTKALQDSNLSWDAATLDRFLASPTSVVPGTAMAVAVPDKAIRDNLIAYFQSVKSAAPASAANTQASQSAGSADWKQDTPGRPHKIDLAALPAPSDSSSVRNSPRLVPKPPDAQLSLPAGFHVAVFASDLLGPRRMLQAPNGDIFVTETRGGRVSVLHPAADGASSSHADVFAQDLRQPFGIAFFPSAAHPSWLYVAETHRVIRYRFRNGDVKARGAPQIVVPELPSGSGHATRDIVFSPDGHRMFVSVGSATNVAEEMSKKTPDLAQAWEATHAPGAAWDMEENRADVLVFEVGAKSPGKIFATGIRNCVGLTLQPKTNDLWCTTNERDRLGDDLVPDYSTRVRAGGFYGWPWYYMGAHEDPRLRGERPDLASKVLVPDVPFQAHSAALNLVFYTATSGKSAFPAEYVGDGFAMFHGSWNRTFRTGHKVVRVRMRNGVPTGEYDDFLTGFIVDDGNAWGRPVAGAVLRDGSLLVSDDGANVIYRISYGN